MNQYELIEKETLHLSDYSCPLSSACDLSSVWFCKDTELGWMLERLTVAERGIFKDFSHTSTPRPSSQLMMIMPWRLRMAPLNHVREFQNTIYLMSRNGQSLFQGNSLKLSEGKWISITTDTELHECVI